MKQIGTYKGRGVWGCSRAEYEDIYGKLGNEIYYLVNNNQLVYKNNLIGLVDRNWNVTDVKPKVFYEPPVETCCVTSFATGVDAVLKSAFEPLVMEPVELGMYSE